MEISEGAVPIKTLKHQLLAKEDKKHPINFNRFCQLAFDEVLKLMSTAPSECSTLKNHQCGKKPICWLIVVTPENTISGTVVIRHYQYHQ